MIFKKSFTIAVICISLVASSKAMITSETPHGQFSVFEGGAACTVIDITAAIHILTTPTIRWHKINVDTLIYKGVHNYNVITKKNQIPHGHYFSAYELSWHFPQLQLLQVINITPQIPSDEIYSPLLDAHESITTTKNLPDIMHAASTMNPIAGIWTANNSSLLICYHNDKWLVLDTHTQSTGTPGASTIFFSSTPEFRTFLTNYPAFQLQPDQQANLTLFKLEQTDRAQLVHDLEPFFIDLNEEASSSSSESPTAPKKINSGHLRPIALLEIDDESESAQAAPARKKRITEKIHRCAHEGCDCAATSHNDVISTPLHTPNDARSSEGMYTAHTVTISNTAIGQHAFSGGQTACTAIAVNAAEQLLLSPTQYEPAVLVGMGVACYKRLITTHGYPQDYFFQAAELAPYFPRINVLQVINVVCKRPSPEDSTAIEHAGEAVVTIDQLPTIIHELGNDFPIAGIWTAHNASQLMYHYGSIWYFFDSHTQNDGSPGASMYTFYSIESFQDFLHRHPVFHFDNSGDVQEQANVTLFTLNQTPAVPERTTEKRIQEPTQHFQRSRIDTDLDLLAGHKRARDIHESICDDTPSAKKYSCSYPGCTYTSNYRTCISRHICIHTNKRPHKCQYPGCTYATIMPSDLKRHMCTHTGERQFKCQYPGCHYAATVKSNLIRHMHLHEKLTTGVQQSANLDHTIIWTPEKFPVTQQAICARPNCDHTTITICKSKPPRVCKKSFKCPCFGCTYTTSDKNRLVAHMYTHSITKPLKCTHPGCDYTASAKGCLKKHMLKHSAEWPLRCNHPGCNYVADTKIILQTHMRIHTDERS